MKLTSVTSNVKGSCDFIVFVYFAQVKILLFIESLWLHQKLDMTRPCSCFGTDVRRLKEGCRVFIEMGDHNPSKTLFIEIDCHNLAQSRLKLRMAKHHTHTCTHYTYTQ